MKFLGFLYHRRGLTLLQRHTKFLELHCPMDVIPNSFFVASLLCLEVFQSKILSRGQVCQCLILIRLFSSSISQWCSKKLYLLILRQCCFDHCKLTVLLNLDLSYYLVEVRCRLLFVEVRLCYHPQCKRKELLYVSHFRCKVVQSSSNQSTFLSINRIQDCLGTELLPVCPPIEILLRLLFLLTSMFLLIPFFKNAPLSTL